MERSVVHPAELARQRIFAWLIDLLILIGVSMLVGGLSWLVAMGYLLLRDGLFDGQSLGKRIIGLKVVAGDDLHQCTFKDSMLRNLLWVIPIVQCVMALTGLYFLMHDPRGRHWGDRLAATEVVSTRGTILEAGERS